MRYVVESCNMILFWLVPIFYYSVPERFYSIYQYNPVAALVLASRNILLDGKAPPNTLLYKLTIVSFVAIALGTGVFNKMKDRFYDHL